MTPPDSQARIENWFVRRGVPHFIHNYSATEDVFTRALPVLIFWFLLSSINGADVDGSWRQMIFASLAGLGLLLLSGIGLNRLRNRPLLSRPQRVGWLEIAIFLVVPAALPVIFLQDWTVAWGILIDQIIVLIVVFAVTSYGLIAISVWSMRRLFKTLGQTFRLFTKALPLLLVGFMFLFINNESWQTAGTLDPALLWTVTGCFGVLSAIFLASQIPKELRNQNQFSSWDEAIMLADDAPVTMEVKPHKPIETKKLGKRQAGNLWLMVFVTQAFRLILVSILIGLLFISLGLLIIQPTTVELWTREPPEIVFSSSWQIFGNPVVLTIELLQVALFLGGFAGVYFSVYATTDKTLRSEFFEDTVHEVRQNLAARCIYLENVIYQEPIPAAQT
ncbi:MAG: hypothetical protein CMH41_05105 [Micrococcales bacterium]|nr:hypothetical protein [Micrococcales bacterium]